MANSQVPATQHARSKAEAARTDMLAHVEKNRAGLVTFLAAFGISFEFFEAGLKVFLMRQMQSDPDFFVNVTPESFMEVLFRASKDGLVCDGKEAAIGVFKGKATYLPMRDGFVKVLWRTGLILDINDNVVTEAEEAEGRFEYIEGTDGSITHRPSMKRTDADISLAAYCVIRLVNGGVIREVVTQDELRKIDRMSRSPARKEWKFQMDRKAAIRRGMGKMPKDPAIEQLLAHDEENYDLSKAGTAQQASRGAVTKQNMFKGRVAKPAKTSPALEAPTQEPIGQMQTFEAKEDREAVLVSDPSADTAEELVKRLDASGSREEFEKICLYMDEADFDWPPAYLEMIRAAVERSANRFDGTNKAKDQEEEFIFRAILSSAEGEQHFHETEGGIWRDSILTKLSALKGDPQRAFWMKNLQFVIQAYDAGHRDFADEIFAAGAERDFPTSLPE